MACEKNVYKCAHCWAIPSLKCGEKSAEACMYVLSILPLSWSVQAWSVQLFRNLCSIGSKV